MDHSSEVMEPPVDRISNLSEVLALDMGEESSDVYHCGQTTQALALVDQTKKRQQSPEDCPSAFPAQTANALSDSHKSWQTIHQKYSDIFAPLDFNASKRGSISSTDSSADLEPPSVGTRGSVLTVDTCFESEKSPSSPFLNISPHSDYKAHDSWFDSGDVVPPITQRRRSNMSDSPMFLHQDSRPTETDTAMSSSPLHDIDEGPISHTSANALSYPSEIPRRRSSRRHQEASSSDGQFGRHTDGHHASTSDSPPDASLLRSNGNLGSPFLYSTHREAMEGKLHAGEGCGRPSIASAEVGFEEWLQSDMAQQFACGDQVLPRPPPANVQETIRFFVTNFPEPMLLCNSLLVDNIRSLSHRVRYNTERSDSPALSGQSSHQQHHKFSKWRWLGSSSSSSSSSEHQAQQDLPEPTTTYNKQEWFVMRNIFPHGSDGLCEALYAYVLVYNYVTSLCLRSPVHPLDLSRPTTPWVPDSIRSNAYGEPDVYSSTPVRLSPTETNAVPRKAASILGLNGDDGCPPTLTGLARPSSRTSLRTSPFSSFRAMPGLFFNGSGQGQRRAESRGASATRPTTPAVAQNSLSQPGSPESGDPSMRPVTPVVSRGTEQGRQLAELRHGLAMCCARLTVTLHRADPNIKKRKEDKDYKVDPSFMRSLCEIVRATEDTIGRCQ